MKIAFFYKPLFIKVYSFFIILPLLAGTPLMVSANVLDNIKAVFSNNQAQAEEITPVNDSNSQNVGIIGTESVNPDIKNAPTPTEPIIEQGGSFVENNDSIVPGVKFDKSSVSDQIMVYAVQEGDTLSEIADLFNVSTNTIIWENNISSKKISIGQKLNILPMTGVKHIVKKGDTVSKIADKYEADSADIMTFNDISAGEGLKQGDIIFVPNGIIKAPVVVAKPSSTHSSSGSIQSSSTSSNNTKVQSGYYIRPAVGGVTSPYGSRRGGFHPGVDIGNARGTTVEAAADGVVSLVVTGCVEGRASCGGGYGNHIEIEHANGTMTRYGHLSKVNVSMGQDVSQGEKIGAIGSTGNSTGPHLHFEIRNSSGSTMRPPVN
jgi:LysM repeat protein